MNPGNSPCGSWVSPITSAAIAEASISLGEPFVDGDAIYWVEGRPLESGRRVAVRRDADARTGDAVPTGFNTRTRVHEYGGGACAAFDGNVYFAHFPDQRVYRIVGGGSPEPMTPDIGGAALRYADFTFDHHRNRIICVREDHRAHDHEPQNTLVALDVNGVNPNGGIVLAYGNDFYSTPRISPAGDQLAWLAWSHPNMPWDGTELWVASVDADGGISQARCIAGGPDESIFQPEWSPDGTLYFVSDRTGWWNLYRWQDLSSAEKFVAAAAGTLSGEIEPLAPMEAEFGLPHWVFGMSTYGFTADGTLVCTYTRQGRWHLALIDPRSGTFETIASPFTDIGGVRTGQDFAVFVAGSPTQTPAIVRFDVVRRTFQPLRSASTLEVDPAYLSVPEAIEFPAADGGHACGFFYPPKNADIRGNDRGLSAVSAGASGTVRSEVLLRDHPEAGGLEAGAGDDSVSGGLVEGALADRNLSEEGHAHFDPGFPELPPLVVLSHGGPTAQTGTSLSLALQYWTSRGFAVLDVNYGGSTGYGRVYRERLNGRWGIVDVDDCVEGALHLVRQGRVDGNRLAIRGWSASGYTTLAALTFRNVFKAGASHYGVSDLEALARDTHKFESRYLDRLIGPYPERKDLYIERSPIHFVDRMSAPLILFQGLEDKVVPPDQAQRMCAAVKDKGIPVALVEFEGEQHGFKKAENIRRALDGELYFLGQIFGFQPAGAIDPLRIENL